MSKTFKFLVISAWLSFLVCLLLPAFYASDGKIEAMGWQVGLLAIQFITRCCQSWGEVVTAWFGCANITMLLLPFSFKLRSFGFDLGIIAFLLIATILAAQLSLSSPLSGKSAWGAGYYLWVASFALASAAFAIRVLPAPARPSTVG